ncbi:MAG: hypothetical protein VX438_17990, partial [Planctomycetota bacterium]|nr:hypothetical protein [Planctomycetota bacterium]
VNLFHRYQAQVDFSDLIGSEHAILVGRSRQPANTLVINDNELEKEYEESWTYYRVIIPVKPSSGKSYN